MWGQETTRDNILRENSLHLLQNKIEIKTYQFNFIVIASTPSLAQASKHKLKKPCNSSFKIIVLFSCLKSITMYLLRNFCPGYGEHIYTLFTYICCLFCISTEYEGITQLEILFSTVHIQLKLSAVLSSCCIPAIQYILEKSLRTSFVLLFLKFLWNRFPTRVALLQNNYLCTYDLYGPVRCDFD